MLSIIVSWRDRIELSQALPTMVESAKLANGDLTIVNYSGSIELLEKQISKHRDALRVINITNQKYFNKASANNAGAASSANPILFFCDCDIILNPSTVLDVSEAVNNTENTFATLAGVRESDVNSRGAKHVVSFGYELRIRTADGRKLCIVDNEEDSSDGTRQAPGLLFVKRSDLLAIQGYNADLHGWGWEDQDMISRLTLGRGLNRVTKGQAIHISHDDTARIANYPEVASRWESRDRMFRKALANYDDANFLGTYERDRILIDKTSMSN